MKKFISIIVVHLFIGLSGCENIFISPGPSGEIPLEGTAFTEGCKGGFPEQANKTSDRWEETCFSWRYNEFPGTLELKHIDATFNCCPDSIYSSFSISGDTLIVHHYEEGGICDCVCNYDVDMVIKNIPSAKLTVKVGYGDELWHVSVFELDLYNEKSGYFCMEKE